MARFTLALLILTACSDPTRPVTDASIPTDTPPTDAAFSRWTTEVTGTHLVAIWGSGAADIYAVGDGGVILHKGNSGTWAPEPSGVTVDLYTVWGSGPNDVYVGGFGATLLHSTGNGVWTPQTIPAVGPVSIFGTGPGDVYFTYASSAGQVYHSTGSGTWTPLAIGVSSSILTTVWGTSATNLYFGGGSDPNFDAPYIVHGPTSPVAEQMPALPDALLRNVVKIWGADANDLYAVGNSNTILHSTGAGAWTLESGPGATDGFDDVYGAHDSIYAIASTTGKLVRKLLGTWAYEQLPLTAPRAIWATPGTFIYVVGDGIVSTYESDTI